jgi:hypothetical protein
MTPKFIYITHRKAKPSGTKHKPKPRTSRPKPDDFIEIVDTPVKSGKRTAKPTSAAPTSTNGLRRNNSQDFSGPVAAPIPIEQTASAITRIEAVPLIETVGGVEYGDTLNSCSTVDSVRDWFLGQQASFNDKVDKAIGWRRLIDDTRAKADAILHGVGTTPAFMVGNDRLALEAFEKLRTHLTGYVSADPANEAALITFITGDGGTSMDRPVIDVRDPRKRVNAVMRKIAPHWFGLIDLAFFWTIQHPAGGLHLQRHEHVIGWGVDFIDKAMEVAQKQSSKFKLNVTKLPRIKVVRAWDTSEVNMARLAAYLLNAPAKGKNWFEYADGSGYVMNHTESKDRYIQFHRLAQIRSVLSLEDVILGGGDGIKIKGSMVDDMRGLAQADARGRSIFHPDELPTFWEDFNQELGQSHWSLPAILRR